jgi:uncharacterized protein YndB with AHSA1/START domain
MSERAIVIEVSVPAPLNDVWQAWTTAQGAQSFFAPQCSIELKPGGAYEMLFDLGAPAGKQGGEGMHIMAMQPPTMLSFTWNAPPHLPSVRDQMTCVVVRLRAKGARETQLTLRHEGWGDGGEWDAAFEYFSAAWAQIVLPRLQYRFTTGPIDWHSPQVP